VDASAIREFPELIALILIREAGWLFLPLRTDPHGDPTELDGLREWPGGVVDAIRVRSETDSMALRMTFGDPPGIVWETSGTLSDVVSEALALPAPGRPSAPRLVRAPAPVLWTPERQS
jgi:hypothetical protein